jgi:hypothetical protein
MIVLAETTPALLQVSLLAEFASQQPRPELKHVLRLAEDGTLSEQIVVQRFQVSQRAAFNILSECASLGLIDQQGGLTPEGQAFLKDDRGHAYVPEHGCFNVLLGRHPAFGQVLLNIERTPEDIELADITDQHDVILRPGDKALGKAGEFKFGKYLVKNRRGGLKSADQWSARLSVELTSPGAKSATGKIQWRRGDGAKDEDSLTLLTPAQDLWNAALRQIPEAIGTWKTKPQPHLAIPYQSAKPEEATHFLRAEIRIAGPHHLDSEEDHWAQFTLRDIPIGPANEAEARAWVDALFFKAVQAERSYLNLAEATELYQQTSECNPILAALAPSYRHSDALRHAGQLDDRQAYWALQAPEDLEDPHRMEKASRSRPTERTTFQAESSVRFRPAERMSFQSFLAKVVGTASEDTHFLLYDKFALRGGNWRNVPAFLEACQGAASKAKLTLLYQPRSRVDIEKDGPDPKPCAAKVAHKNCREVFNQTQLPHDRYLFTVSDKEIKAWQLSNSPLAAKGDFGAELDADSPLEWPALTVFPVAFTDLEPGFQSFLNQV